MFVTACLFQLRCHHLLASKRGVLAAGYAGKTPLSRSFLFLNQLSFPLQVSPVCRWFANAKCLFCGPKVNNHVHEAVNFRDAWPGAREWIGMNQLFDNQPDSFVLHILDDFAWS